MRERKNNELLIETRFQRRFQKIQRKDKKLAGRIVNVLDIMMNNPFDARLKTHKVNTRYYGMQYSSRVDCWRA